MIDTIFFIGINIIILALFYIGRREEVELLVLVSGMMLMLVGVFTIIHGIGEANTITMGQTEINSTNITISTINRTSIEGYRVLSELTHALGLIFLLLGLYIALAQAIAYLRT